jgi:hypothetical protein
MEVGDQVFCMLSAFIFHAKVVDNEAEHDGARDVSEEAGSVLCGGVAKGGKVLDEVVVGNDASLQKAVHAFADLTST